MAQAGVEPIQMLFTLYFMPCEVMHRYQVRLKGMFYSTLDLETRKQVYPEFMVFTHYWLASLFVVADGWKQLRISDPKIDAMIKKHWKSLWDFRNAIFHFQRQDTKHRQFFAPDKFNWAEELHASLRTFFTAQGM
jgi:hypothetical protein